MSTTPTNNPIPSESPKDLAFNAGKIDEFVNSPEDAFSDRFGIARLTLTGIQAEADNVILSMGFIPVDSFEAGATISSRNQALHYLADNNYYRWDGALPKTVAAGSTPTSSGGVSVGAWVNITDLTLRGQLASSSAGNGAALIKSKKDYSGTIERTQQSINNDLLNVKDFGAKGDGVTDDTAAIQALIDYAKAQNAAGKNISIFAPAGIYMVSGLTLYAFSSFYGAGRATRFKLIAGSNKSVIYGVNSDALWGYSGVDATEFVYNADIHDFVIDGGVDGVTVPFSTLLSGHGMSIWGSRNRIYNIDICNCAEYGIRSEYKDQNLDYLAYYFENTMYSIRINNCGKTGWECNGPHDAAIHDVGIINGSRLGNGLYDGFHAGTQMSGNIGNLHVSNAEDNTGTGSAVRHRYAGNIEGPCRFYGGTTFEGSIDCVRINSSAVQFDDSCTFYIPWGDGFNGTVMWIESGSAFCIIRGKFGGAGSFRPQTNWGIRFRPGSSSVSHNDIEVLMEGIEIPISFGNSTTVPDADGGKNRVKMIAYYTGSASSSPATYGVPNTENGTQVDVIFSGNSQATLKSEVQTKIQTGVASGASFTWAFKYPFQSAPAVAISILSPAGTPTGPVWISSISNTYVTITNSSGQTTSISATASRSVSE
ncbi:MAG: hypothetical protein [Bacteriophage sp.]|nr:MAG: hypothetical protein [Bacteriophage sp.]